MKFRDGMWHTAEGLQVEYAEEVYETERTDAGGLRLLCPTRPIRARGDTLNRPTLTLTVEAAMDGVVAVEIEHWAGARRRGPDVELFPGGKPDTAGVGAVTTTPEGTTLTAGALAVTVSSQEHSFGLQFADPASGHEYTALGSRSVGFALDPAPPGPMALADLRATTHWVFAQTDLGIGESVHGLGERFGAFNKVGQAVALWNADGGTSSEQAYKNVALWLSSRGYGVFVDTPARVELEVGSARCSRVEMAVAAQRLRLFVLAGPTPRAVLRRYAVLTGAAPPLPPWSFGLWLSTSFTTDYDEATVARFLTGMRDRGIAVDVFHYDCFWMRAFRWTDFVFDAARFPDPAGQIARLKAAGLCRRVCVWINPYLAQHGAAFRHAAAHGYLLLRDNGDVWQWDQWQAGMGLVDFTNPAACAWFAACLQKLFDVGVDAVKTDFGERIPVAGVRWHDPAVDPARMHNHYAVLYNAVVHRALAARYGPGRAVLFARSAAAGAQRFPLHWGGDCESTPAAMAESLRGGLSLGLGAFAFWSVDIGGFEGTPPPWIYKRWVGFGLLCSHSRLHGSNSYRVPWLLDGDDRSPAGCAATLARWVARKNRLLPYLLAQAARITGFVSDAGRGEGGELSVDALPPDAGLPLSLRAVALEYPDDPVAWSLDRQFFVGGRLLAAPVLARDGVVQFYLPAGRWTCFFTNRVHTGPVWLRQRHGFGSLPLFVRENTILVLGSAVAADADADAAAADAAGPPRSAVYDYAAAPEVVLYHVQPGAEADVVGLDPDTGDAVPRGTLRVGPDGQLAGVDALSGAFTVSHNARVLSADEEAIAAEIEDL